MIRSVFLFVLKIFAILAVFACLIAILHPGLALGERYLAALTAAVWLGVLRLVYVAESQLAYNALSRDRAARKG